jgi:predicted MPP superfamily phosphohydrolase
MGSADKGAWHARFVRVLTMWTMLVHVPWAIALGLGLSGGLGWIALLVGVLAWLLPLLLLSPLVFDTLPDRPRSSFRVNLLERPYLVHWAATHVSALGWLPGLVLLPWRSDPWAWPFAAYAVALVALGWGAFVTCRRLRIREIDLSVSGLPPEFIGYRIAHLSDLHVGSVTPPHLVARWLERVRDVPVDLTVITGDLVTSGEAFHDPIADLVGRLKGPVLFVPGNHDYFGDGLPLFRRLEARGVRVLRNERVVLERGEATLVVAGMDDVWTRRGDVAASLRGREAGVTVLLAHDPAVFDEAASMGADVMLSGHTHGGQIGVPGLARFVNLTKMANRYSLGVYRKGASTLVVSGGMGCTGLPIRFGVPPEVLVIRLQRA